MSKIQLRRDTSTNFTAANPTLAAGEPSFETNTGKFKVGDGTTPYNSLSGLVSQNNLSGFKVFLLEQFDPNIYTTADGRPALEAAVSACVAAGGGQIRFNGFWNLGSATTCLSGLTTPIELTGPGAPTNVASQIAGVIYTGTGATTAIDATGSTGLSFRNMALEYNNAGFTGTLLDLSGNGTRNGSGHKVRDCLIRPVGTLDTHGAMIKVAANHTIEFDGNWVFASRAIVGPNNPPTGFANRVKINGGYMQGYSQAPIMNPDLAWLIDSVTFEPTYVGGKPSAVGHTTGSVLRSITFRDCYFGDDTSVGAWVDIVGGIVTLSGGIATTMTNGSSVIKVSGGNTRIIIGGGFGLTNTTGSYLIDNSGAADPTQQIFDFSAWNQISFSAMTSLINGTIPTRTKLMDSAGNITFYSKPSFVQGLSIPPSNTVNLLTASQASSETGTVDVDTNNNVSSLTSSTDFALSGTHSWKFVAAATASDTSFGTGLTHSTYRASVTAGVTYTAFASVYKPTGTTGTTCSLSIVFYDNTGTAISGVAGQPQSATAALTVGAWTQTSTLTVVAPLGAVTAIVVVRVQGATAADAYYADCLQLAAGSSTTWVAPGSGSTGVNLNGTAPDFGGARLANVGAGINPNDTVVVSQLGASNTTTTPNVTGSFTISQTSGYGRWFCHGTSSGALPVASGNTARLTLVNEDTGTGVLTITPQAGDDIYGQTTYLVQPGNAVDLISNGTNGWRLV